MSLKAIKISCQGAGVLPLSSLLPYQDELKTLDTEDHEKLRREILEEGFSYPFAVWESPKSEFFILDGHQRRKVLLRLQIEGYALPAFPVIFVHAEDAETAKHKLLAAASNYGKITKKGLSDYLKDLSFDHVDLVKSFRFADVDIHEFVEEQLNISPEIDEIDLGDAVIGADHPTPVANIPKATDQAPNQPDANFETGNQVRMVQLYFNAADHEEFLKSMAYHQKRLSTKNLTDTIMAVLRETHTTEQ